VARRDFGIRPARLIFFAFINKKAKAAFVAEDRLGEAWDLTLQWNQIAR
jgi:hypothetical protein